MLYQLYHDLFSGASFSDSARKNQLFTQTQSATIQCAEKNQSLREAFLGIHEYLYYQRSRRSKQSIFIYPCVFMIIMTVSFSYYVANNVLNIYMFDLWLQGKKLSFFSSLFMLLYSGSFARVIVFILIAIFGLRLLFYGVSLIKYGPVRRVIDRIILHIPIKRAIVLRRESLYFFFLIVVFVKSGSADSSVYFSGELRYSTLYFSWRIARGI
ncbi:MAG: hypothetical protein LRY30_00570 [Gammaproteobacteria bacterium]|nr:hypothetical protein [Gammaproteobacteria bacterium]